MEVQRLDDGDRRWLRQLVIDEWGLPVVSISGAYDPSTLPGFVAVDRGQRIGAVTYRRFATEMEVVTLNSLQKGRGVGTALLAVVKAAADEEGRRLWLITTNQNINAIRFYQRRGMDMRALHRNFVEVVRQHKPAVGQGDSEGISFRHAIEFSY